MADYFKIPELARRLDVSEPTARRMVKSGKLPSVFVGGAYRVSETDLEEYLEGAKVRPGGSSGKAQAPLWPESEDAAGDSGLDAASVLQRHLTLIEEARDAREAGDQERLGEIHRRMLEEVTSALIRLGPLQEPESSKRRRSRQAQRGGEESTSEAS